MSFTSFAYIIFLVLLTVLYYCIPKRMQWILLLAASYVFYCSGGVKTVVYLLFTTVTAYAAGLLLGALNEKRKALSDADKARLQDLIRRKKKAIVAAACVLNFGMLFMLKYWDGSVQILDRVLGISLPSLGLLMPLGVSFFVFQSIGYVIDVYRGKQPPQRNLARFALFTSFFPQIVQGPISRYHQLAPQLFGEHPLDYENLRNGIQLLLWGFFKKILIAERAGAVVETVYGDPSAYPGSILALGTLAYCIQLYCDFSGGIDITRGTAQMLGIGMTENFRRPLFACSLTDFWRRWHITLGGWMRDYVFYPLSLSRPFGRLGRWSRKHIKGKAGKIFATSLATFIVYLLIGIWHGSSLKYIFFGFYNGIIITVSLLMEATFVSWRARLHMTEHSRLWNLFRIARTCVIVFIGRYITRAPRLLTGLSMLWHTFSNFQPAALLSDTVFSLGIGRSDYLILALAVLVLVVVEYAQERGVQIRQWLAARSAAVQFFAVLFMLLVLLFGTSGDYVPAQFIYAQF